MQEKNPEKSCSCSERRRGAVEGENVRCEKGRERERERERYNYFSILQAAKSLFLRTVSALRENSMNYVIPDEISSSSFLWASTIF